MVRSTTLYDLPLPKMGVPNAPFVIMSSFECNGKGKGLDILDVALLINEMTREQQHFTILEVAADWHELLVQRRGMQPSIDRDCGQVDPRRSTTDIPSPQSAALGLHPVA